MSTFGEKGARCATDRWCRVVQPLYERLHQKNHYTAVGKIPMVQWCNPKRKVADSREKGAGVGRNPQIIEKLRLRLHHCTIRENVHAVRRFSWCNLSYRGCTTLHQWGVVR